MVNNCIVQSCRSEGENGGFFKLPKKENLREAWVEKLALSPWFIKTTKTYRVCFRHFPKEAFNTSGKILTVKKGIKQFCSSLQFFTKKPIPNPKF